MNARSLPALLVVAVLAAAAGWYAARHSSSFSSASSHAAGGTNPTTAPTERRVLFYQSAMHPWIKSDRPGKCTICGMDLTPVFEGDTALAVGPGLVTLGSNSISVLNVQTTPVRKGTLSRTLVVAGTFFDDDSRHRFLSAYTPGRIESLAIPHVGAEVVAGQPLARFYSPTLIEAERQFLALSRGATPATTTDGAAESQLLRDAATQRLLQLGLAPAQIAALPDKSPTNTSTEILAPASGTVVARFVYPGQYVMEGEKLFEMADLSTLWFQFDAYEQDLPWLQVGQSVDITTPSLPGQTFRAPIQFIDPNLAEMTRSTRVRVAVTNPPVVRSPQSTPERLLRHRLYGEGRVAVSFPDLVLVPRSAVLSPAGRPLVYVDKSGGTFEQRNVRLGRRGDSDYEVLAGLEPGDAVVTHGNLMIDAQAQLNQAIDAAANTPTNTPATNAPALGALTQSQLDVVTHFLPLADAPRQALAADDLTAFNAATAQLHTALASLAAPFPPDSPWSPLVQGVVTQGHLEPASDLRSARKSYHPLGAALVDLARALRVHAAPGAFKDLKVYQCPMTAEAFDGAPPRAQWLQLAAPLRNPWFGREMIECGVEVRD